MHVQWSCVLYFSTNLVFRVVHARIQILVQDLIPILVGRKLENGSASNGIVSLPLIYQFKIIIVIGKSLSHIIFKYFGPSDRVIRRPLPARWVDNADILEKD